MNRWDKGARNLPLSIGDHKRPLNGAVALGNEMAALLTVASTLELLPPDLNTKAAALVERWRAQLGGKHVVEGHPRHVGLYPGHLSECLLVAHPDNPHGCTCDDYYPDGDSG